MRAIDADELKTAFPVCDNSKPVLIASVRATINHMPTIEPERKKGKWVPQNLNKSGGMISTAVYYYPKCSVCGANANYTNFCPKCGAKMEEGEEK